MDICTDQRAGHPSTESTKILTLRRKIESSLQASREEEHRVNEYYRARIGDMTKEIQKLNKAIIKRNRTIYGLRKCRTERISSPRIM